MDLIACKKRSFDMDKIYLDLEILKQRINYFIHAENGMKMDDLKTKKIRVLAIKDKRLSVQHEEIKREIQHYERMYEKALIKKVKDKKAEIEQDKKKLEDLKEKCKKLDVQDIKTEKQKSSDLTTRGFPPSLRTQNTKFREPKGLSVIARNKKKKTMFKRKNTSIKEKIKIKVKENAKSKGRKLSRIMKQKKTRLNDKIKIQIRRNKKSSRRELFFLNDSKTKQAFSNLVKKKENKLSNFRECRITLKKLTEEQAKLYTTEKQLIVQRKNQKISQESSPQNNKNKSTINKSPTWHIRIPRSVFDESQKETQNLKLNVSDNVTNVKRTRSFKR